MINPKDSWRAEFYFISSLIRNPVYLRQIDDPGELLANRELKSLWRMVDQAFALRGSGTKRAAEPITLEEITLTAEYDRSALIDPRAIWPDVQNSSIQANPETWHDLLLNYYACRYIEENVFKNLRSVAEKLQTPDDALHAIQSAVTGVRLASQFETKPTAETLRAMWDGRDERPIAKVNLGFPKLDDLIGALVPGCSYLFGGRTNHGKSSWIANCAAQQAKAGHRVGLITLEDGPQIWASRWLSMSSGVPLKKIRDDILSRGPRDAINVAITDGEASAIESTMDLKHLQNILVAEAKGARLLDVLRLMGELRVMHEVDVIWIDYVQAIYAESGDGRSRRDFLEFAWSRLEAEAERLQIPLCFTAQLNREWEKDPGGARPSLRHVEYAGHAEQKCYVGAIVYRPSRDPRLSVQEREQRSNEFWVNIEKSKLSDALAFQYDFDAGRCQLTEV